MKSVEDDIDSENVRFTLNTRNFIGVKTHRIDANLHVVVLTTGILLYCDFDFYDPSPMLDDLSCIYVVDFDTLQLTLAGNLSA